MGSDVLVTMNIVTIMSRTIVVFHVDSALSYFEEGFLGGVCKVIVSGSGSSIEELAN